MRRKQLENSYKLEKSLKAAKHKIIEIAKFRLTILQIV